LALVWFEHLKQVQTDAFNRQNRTTGISEKTPPKAFSSEVDTGSREENASKQKIRASVLIRSEPILL